MTVIFLSQVTLGQCKTLYKTETEKPPLEPTDT